MRDCTKEVFDRLKPMMDEREFRSWFGDSRVKVDPEETVVLIVRNPVVADYTRENYRNEIQFALAKAGIRHKKIMTRTLSAEIEKELAAEKSLRGGRRV